MRKILIAALTVFVFAFIACSDDKNDKPQKYSVTVTGGTADVTEAAKGDEITLTPDTKPGYEFNEWVVVSGSVEGGDDNKFTMPAGDVEVKAEFVLVNGFDAIHDLAFRKFCEQFDTDEDGILTEDECEAVTEIEVSDKSIGSLVGIEIFTALAKLDCLRNNITSLNVSRNTALIWLRCSQNNLTSLDVSGCTALMRLYCFGDNITSLDISNNTALVDLECFDNGLTSLDISNNNELNRLICYGNNLTSLDVSNNTALSIFWCGDNDLTSLDVSNNTALEVLSCEDNNITVLDVSNCVLLRDLTCDPEVELTGWPK